MPYEVLPDLSQLSLAQVAELVTNRKLPPVEQWNPDKSGESEMRIAADGRWYHQGGLISRPAMVRAFSSLLRREKSGDYWLVTPHEKLRIEVEDVPFLAVEATSEGSGKEAQLAFRLNSDDLVIAGSDHPIELRLFDGSEVPYLHVRSGLWARASRPLYYELAGRALEADAERPGLWSGGLFFPLVSAG